MPRCSSTSSFVTRRSSHSPHDRIFFFSQNEAPDKARPEAEKFLSVQQVAPSSKVQPGQATILLRESTLQKQQARYLPANTPQDSLPTSRTSPPWKTDALKKLPEKQSVKSRV
ncbi:uncharacterized protein RSE6_02521 [Rhynchosporium secalis]|uniref:Uncharacterized protein n=1 Tax=Rhynchosporium secalis TaxID=38038 RepID=A0A1E1M0G2_RHYSE|nr:uncharacterized protein RSE6_02521 [Rhynchosporium secalis]